MNKLHSREIGFSLIEMTIVIFMIGMISTVSLVNYRKAERQKRVVIASDIVINAIRNAQNFSLTSRQLSASTCVQGKSPQSYIMLFGSAQNMGLYGVDKCNGTFLIESYNYPANTRVQNNGYKLNGVNTASLQIKFAPPFGKLTAGSGDTPNSGVFNSFSQATITVEVSDGSYVKTVTVDGISGRIGE